MEWILLTLVFGVCKGMREGIKKKAVQKSGVFEVLFWYTLISFLLVAPTAHNVTDIPHKYYFFIGIKSAAVFFSWILSFYSIKHMPVGFAGIMDMSRVLFSTSMAILIMREDYGAHRAVGLLLVLSGLIFLNGGKGKNGREVETKYAALMLVSCFLAALSGVMDKWLTKTVTSAQLQFWFMLFMTVMYGVYLVASKTKISVQTLKTNPWILILSVIFVIGDRSLFIANAYESSRITVMTLVKQASVPTALICGRFMFNEKITRRSVICALVIISGIAVAAL